jgi:signal peptidase I
MMNDEQGSPDRPASGGHGGGYRGAYAAGPGPAAQPDADATDPFGVPAPGLANGARASDGATATDGAIASDRVPAGGATATGDEQQGSQPPTVRKRRGSTWRELPILIVVALTIALVIKTFVVQPFYIPSSSMEDTLLIGDKVLVNKLVYHFRSVQRGDIIVFNGIGSWNAAPPPTKPDSNPFARAYDATLKPLFHSIAGLFGTPIGQTDYIKRVIGVPGDNVACCNAQGLVTVNGVPLHESSYLYPGATPSQIHFNKVVPPGRLWVMGDNRQISDDSRLRPADPGGGTIPISQVIGRAFVIVWPPSHWRFLPIPATFSQPALSKTTAASAGPAQSSAAAQLVGTPVQPGAPYVPLAAGLVGAVPLTWLQRRTRQRLMRRLRAGPERRSEAGPGQRRRLGTGPGQRRR